jgi:hypothetical protein
MSKLRYILPVLWNAVVVIIAIGIVSSLEFDSTILPASIALMILVSIQSGLALQLRTTMKIAADNQRSFGEILEKLGEADLAEELKADSSEIESVLQQTNYKVIVNSIGSTIVWIIAVIGILIGLE